MKVLALDPGGTTGWACASVWDDDAWGPGMIADIGSSLMVGQIKVASESENAYEIIKLIGALEPDVVVAEDFVLFPDREHSSKRDGTTPMRILAVLDFFWWMATWGPDADRAKARGGLPVLAKQMPGERTVITDEMIRKWGWWRTQKRQGGGPHAMDALRHLIVYVRKQGR